MITFNFDVKIIDKRFYPKVLQNKTTETCALLERNPEYVFRKENLLLNPFHAITNEKNARELLLISDFGNIYFVINKYDYHSKYLVNRYHFNFSMNFKINFRSFCFLKRSIRMGPQILFPQCCLFILLEEIE